MGSTGMRSPSAGGPLRRSDNGIQTACGQGVAAGGAAMFGRQRVQEAGNPRSGARVLRVLAGLRRIYAAAAPRGSRTCLTALPAPGYLGAPPVRNRAAARDLPGGERVKVVMPVAGKGTRLRPHTHLVPKPLLKVGDKPVLSYILDDLRELGVNEAVLITGHLKEKVEEFMSTEYPDFKAEYTEQKEQLGTADAIRLAEPFVHEEMLIIFVDTLFDADLALVKRLPEDVAGVIWAMEVEDYQRFGVIVTDENGFMQKIIEKPSEPVSKLANIGLYYIRDWKLLFEGIHHVMASPPGGAGEYYLTDAFQYM